MTPLSLPVRDDVLSRKCCVCLFCVVLLFELTIADLGSKFVLIIVLCSHTTQNTVQTSETCSLGYTGKLLPRAPVTSSMKKKQPSLFRLPIVNYGSV